MRIPKLFIISLSYGLVLAVSLIAAQWTFLCFKETFKTLEAKPALSNNAETTEKSDDSNNLNLSEITTYGDYLDCLEKHFENSAFCQPNNKQAKALPEPETEQQDVLGEIDSNVLIKFIEKLLVAGLAVQLFLTIYTLCLPKYAFFDQYVFHISDWAINTPPILGVLANLVSFSLLLSHGNDVQELFSGYFFQAVITTLIGGIFYIINLALKIIIHPRIETMALK